MTEKEDALKVIGFRGGQVGDEGALWVDVEDDLKARGWSSQKVDRVLSEMLAAGDLYEPHAGRVKIL